LFEIVSASRACRLEWIDPDRFEAARKMLLKHLDLGWSFTDCVSFQVMQELRLREALTKDSNFEQAGFEALLRPS
jgi:predicted nucleic acid-binding protein